MTFHSFLIFLCNMQEYSTIFKGILKAFAMNCKQTATMDLLDKIACGLGVEIWDLF